MIIAVNYSYDPGAPLAEHRPAHRAYLAKLAEDSVVITSGPLPDVSGALLILNADSAEHALRILESDPFYRENCIAERTATQWQPVIGALAP